MAIVVGVLEEIEIVNFNTPISTYIIAESSVLFQAADEFSNLQQIVASV